VSSKQLTVNREQLAVGSEELKRCPFCGAAPKMAHAVGEWWVSCVCDVGGPMGATESQAAAGWNRRVDAGASAARWEKWCYWTDRIAAATEKIALSTMVIVLAVIGWELVKLYRSLPPGSMRWFGSL
jgi:hypothetical protein